MSPPTTTMTMSSGVRAAGISPVVAASSTHAGQRRLATMRSAQPGFLPVLAPPAAVLPQEAPHVVLAHAAPGAVGCDRRRQQHRRPAAPQYPEARCRRAHHARDLGQSAGDVDHRLGARHRHRAGVGRHAGLEVQRRPGTLRLVLRQRRACSGPADRGRQRPPRPASRRRCCSSPAAPRGRSWHWPASLGQARRSCR